MEARDIMTTAVVCATPDMPLPEAARLLAQTDCGALPVVEAATTRQPIGLITDRDIVCRSLAVGKDPLRLTVRDCMSGPCITVDERSSLDDCCDTMEVNRIRRVVVVAADGRVTGIIAQADVAKAAPESKTAEVVREISLSQEALQATF